MREFRSPRVFPFPLCDVLKKILPQTPTDHRGRGRRGDRNSGKHHLLPHTASSCPGKSGQQGRTAGNHRKPRGGAGEAGLWAVEAITGRSTAGYTGRRRARGGLPGPAGGCCGRGVNAQARSPWCKHRAGNNGPWRGSRGGLVRWYSPPPVRAATGREMASVGHPHSTGQPRPTPERKKPRTRRGVGGWAGANAGER